MKRERIIFRLIQAPCCNTMLCFVNPRLPNYCPECGTFIFPDLRVHHPERILITDEKAWIEYSE